MSKDTVTKQDVVDYLQSQEVDEEQARTLSSLGFTVLLQAFKRGGARGDRKYYVLEPLPTGDRDKPRRGSSSKAPMKIRRTKINPSISADTRLRLTTIKPTFTKEGTLKELGYNVICRAVKNDLTKTITRGEIVDRILTASESSPTSSVTALVSHFIHKDGVLAVVE